MKSYLWEEENVSSPRYHLSSIMWHTVVLATFSQA